MHEYVITYIHTHSTSLQYITKLINLHHELTQCFEDEQSTMRSELAKKANHIEELKKENKVAKVSYQVAILWFYVHMTITYMTKSLVTVA